MKKVKSKEVVKKLPKKKLPPVKVKPKVSPATTFEKEPVCYSKGIHENDCLKCVFIGRCLYNSVSKDVAEFKEKKPAEYAAAKVTLNDLTYLYKEISSTKM